MVDENGYSTGEPPLYYEWHGDRESSRVPVLLIHGGGSTIESNWGHLIPELGKSRRILAVELQGHGRTSSGTGPASFDGSANGVAHLLTELGSGALDVMGPATAVR